MKGVPVVDVSAWTEVVVRNWNVCWFDHRTANCHFYAKVRA